ncbi:MAG: single-stranded DNA-binding protein [Clostridia bacterium]|nr:single-stranded DNA-binding protein [Clostridia bacterium]
MDYNKTSLEEQNNKGQIIGKIIDLPKLSHEIEGESFYELKVEVERLSKAKDIIPITISERLINNNILNIGELVYITGEYRSYNKLENDKSKLILHFFAKEIIRQENIDSSINLNNTNEVKLIGYICKKPIYRKTPFDREICDILLAVNRPNYNKSDYIPCILWGRNARFMEAQSIGTKVEIIGRIQSRNYNKLDEKGDIEERVAYEVSCQKLSVLSKLSDIKISKNDNSKSSSISV